MVNRGDDAGGRFKASVTRTLKPKALAMAKAPATAVTAAPALPRAETPDTTLAAPAAPMGKVGGPMMRKAAKSRTFRFHGSMKKGGVISRTGLWLMHKGEKVTPVRSPYKKGG